MIGDREILLEVDGGITKTNIEHVATLGADLIVSGSAIYDGVAPLDNARYMLDAVGRRRQQRSCHEQCRHKEERA